MNWHKDNCVKTIQDNGFELAVQKVYPKQGFTEIWFSSGDYDLKYTRDHDMAVDDYFALFENTEMIFETNQLEDICKELRVLRD